MTNPKAATVLAAAVALGALGALGLGAPAAADTLAITGATIYQRSDKKLDNATIVIRDGRIAEVGTGSPCRRARRGSTARTRSSPPG